jgi:nitric oxide reductase NorQ protein
MTHEAATLIEPRAVEGFVETPYVGDLISRAMRFIDAGYPVHLRGISGTGKTTMALQLASKIARPIVLIHGDDELTTSDLVGAADGYRIRKVVDNFIHSVSRREEDYLRHWVDNRLTVACRHGFTLIYDEFTRARPETNNVLLSVLQERILDLPVSGSGQHYLAVSPEFHAIFTSNPEEYAGVHKTQDALRDRMVTLDLDCFDEETECAIAASRSGMTRAEVEPIVKIVRAFRAREQLYDFAPTVRAAVMIAKTTTLRKTCVDGDDPIFRQVCVDVLGSETTRLGIRAKRKEASKVILELVEEHCRLEACLADAPAKPSARSRRLALA